MSLVEVLLAVAVFALIASGVVGAIVYGREGPATVGLRNRANMIAKEGIEAVRSIDYNSLAAGTYGVSSSGSTWALTGSSDTVDTVFTRTVTISVVDAQTKQAVVSVSYNLNGQRSEVASITTRLTAWAWSWANGMQDATLDITAATATTDGRKVKILGDYAYVIRGTTNNDLRVIKIANSGIPTTPTDVGGRALTAQGNNLVVGVIGANTYVWVAEAGGNPEVEEFNVTNPASIPAAVAINPSGNQAGNAVDFSNDSAGQFVYIGRQTESSTAAEFYIYDVSTPATPVAKGKFDYGLLNNTSINDMVVLTNVVTTGDCYAYIATSDTANEVQVLTCTTRANNPTRTNLINLSTANAATSINGYKVASNDIRLQVGSSTNFFASKLSAPTTVSATSAALAIGSAVLDVAKDSARDYAFVASAATGAEVKVINVGTITNASALPAALKSFRYPASGTEGTINGVTYNNSTIDRVVAVGTLDTQELTVFSPR